MVLSENRNQSLTLDSLAKLVDGEIVTHSENLDEVVEFAFASDLMSDVLMLESDKVLLITGLANPQVIRTAEMSDINYIIIARRKKCSTEMLELARECNITLIESNYSVFRISGLLFGHGIKPIF